MLLYVRAVKTVLHWILSRKSIQFRVAQRSTQVMISIAIELQKRKMTQL